MYEVFLQFNVPMIIRLASNLSGFTVSGISAAGALAVAAVFVVESVLLAVWASPGVTVGAAVFVVVAGVTVALVGVVVLAVVEVEAVDA